MIASACAGVSANLYAQSVIKTDSSWGRAPGVLQMSFRQLRQTACRVTST
jgi:predicted oxidoreductase